MSPLSPWWGYGMYLATFGLLGILRAPFMARSARAAVRERRSGLWESFVQFVVGLGSIGLPAASLLGWFRFADQSLAAWRLPAGAVVLAGAAVLFYRAHADLGANWSSTLTVRKEHTLVSNGVYARIRHPMYASFLVLAVGQAIALPNWIGGLAGLATLAFFLPARILPEERMMVETFGDEYRAYARRTGRVFPRLTARS